MTAFEAMLGCFFVGASPGAFLFVRAGRRSQALLRDVERIAFEDGRRTDPIFELTGSTENGRAIRLDPTSLLRETDSPRLRAAKLSLLDSRQDLMSAARRAGAAMLLGALAGALVGWGVAAWLALPGA